MVEIRWDEVAVAAAFYPKYGYLFGSANKAWNGSAPSHGADMRPPLPLVGGEVANALARQL